MATGGTRVIAASRGKTALLSLIAIGFCVAGAWLIREQFSYRAIIAGWAGLVVFGFAGVLCLLQLIWPPRLVLDSDGVAFHYLIVTYRRRWADVARIDVDQIRSTRIARLVARPGGKDLALGGAWSVSVDELVASLQTYLDRYGQTAAT